MQTFVVSDNQPLSIKVRRVLLQCGHDCPDSHVVSLSAGSTIVASAELTVLVMSPDPERGLVALRDMSSALGGISLRSAQSKRFLAVGPADARLILRTIREGAQEYLDENEIETELEAIIDRIASEMRPMGDPGQVISVLAPSGGSGSSTIACNIATQLAKDHQSVVLFDLKLGAGVMDAMLDLKPEHTLADLCNHVGKIDKGMFEKLLLRHSGSGLRLLCPPNSFNDIGYVTAEGVKEGVKIARGLYKYVIIDVDRTYGPEQIEALVASDIVVLVLRLDFTSLRNTRQTLEHLERLGISRERIRLVVNRYGQPKEMRLAQAEEALGIKVFAYIPDEPYTINRANNNGMPVVLESPKSKVARSIIDLAHNLNGQKKA